MVRSSVTSKYTQLICLVESVIPAESHGKRLPTPPKSRRYLSQSGDVDYVPSPFEELKDLNDRVTDRLGISNVRNVESLSEEAYDKSVDEMAVLRRCLKHNLLSPYLIAPPSNFKLLGSLS